MCNEIKENIKIKSNQTEFHKGYRNYFKRIKYKLYCLKYIIMEMKKIITGVQQQ